MQARIDHLVVVADSLAAGVAWCEATLGITPGPGGEHPLMGTHNRLFRIATVNYPRAYFEIIAINPDKPQPVPARTGRWFDMDDAALQARIRTQGPQLAHFVANVPDIRTALAALAARGIDRGMPLKASRMTARGMLEWQISVRDDGRRLLDGALPTVIEWGDAHPIAGMPESGVTLQSLCVSHPQEADVRAAHEAIGMTGVTVKPGAANIVARLNTPRGAVTLESKGL
ncbi:MAG: VOC family protein [Pseudomonadota bacterium]